MEVHQQKDQQWELESQILNAEKHLEQDIVVALLAQKQWLDIGLVESGKILSTIN